MLDSDERLATGDPEYWIGLINEKVAAKFIGYRVRTLQKWRVTGDGPQFVKVSARSIRYRRRDLMEWAESHLVGSTSEAGPRGDEQ